MRSSDSRRLKGMADSCTTLTIGLNKHVLICLRKRLILSESQSRSLHGCVFPLWHCTALRVTLASYAYESNSRTTLLHNTMNGSHTDVKCKRKSDKNYIIDYTVMLFLQSVICELPIQWWRQFCSSYMASGCPRRCRQ